MSTWNNLDTLESFKELSNVKKVNLVEAMTGENGAERVKKYSVPMAAGLAYNYAAKQVDDDVLEGLKKLAKEAQLTEKYAALYNGEMINTGEKRLVLYLPYLRYYIKKVYNDVYKVFFRCISLFPPKKDASCQARSD
jgi:glucose-6-phosphate isomerase